MEKVVMGLMALALAGCEPPAADDRQRAAERWCALDLSDYDYQVERSCFCTEPYLRPPG